VIVVTGLRNFPDFRSLISALWFLSELSLMV